MILGCQAREVHTAAHTPSHFRCQCRVCSSTPLRALRTLLLIQTTMRKVPDLFKRRSTLASLRPSAVQQHVQRHLQQQSQHDSLQAKEPQLLQHLYACLDEAAVREGLSQYKQQQAGNIKHRARRQLDAYHRVFELLLASLTTYRCGSAAT